MNTNAPIRELPFSELTRAEQKIVNMWVALGLVLEVRRLGEEWRDFNYAHKRDHRTSFLIYRLKP